MKKQTGGLYFTVEGEFITDLARKLWAEGAEAKALRTLTEGFLCRAGPGVGAGASFVPYPIKDAVDVVTGFKEVIGTNECETVPFMPIKKKGRILVRVETDSRGLPLPTLIEAFNRKDRQIEELGKQLREIVEAANKLIDERQDIDRTFTRIARAREKVGRGTKRIVAERKAAEKKLKPPQPTTNFKMWSQGWLSPEGKFYGCDARRHVAFAFWFSETGEYGLEIKGWLKLQGWRWIRPWKFFETKNGRLTQPQLDALFDWHRAKGVEMEEWMRNAEDAE